MPIFYHQNSLFQAIFSIICDSDTGGGPTPNFLTRPASPAKNFTTDRYYYTTTQKKNNGIRKKRKKEIPLPFQYFSKN